MKANLVVQVRLRSLNKDGSYSERTCLIDNARVKRGSKVTLANSEDPERKWEVVFASETLDAATVHIDWQVGGIRGVSR